MMDETSITQQISNLTVITDDSNQCERDALTDSYGWLIQGILASMAFALLIGKSSVNSLSMRSHLFLFLMPLNKFSSKY